MQSDFWFDLTIFGKYFSMYNRAYASIALWL